MKKLAIAILSLVSFNIFAYEFNLEISDLKIAGFTNQYIANGFGCEGDNISPNLIWKNAPEGTKSFVVTMYDPDAPTGSGWWHWVVANIPADVDQLKQNAGNDLSLLPQNANAVRNDFGHVYYGGPCPPEGTNHRYIFTIYALSIDNITIDEFTSPALIGFLANMHQLGKSTVTFNYER